MRQGQLALSQEEEPVSSAGEANAILVPVGLHVDMLAVGCSHSWLPKFCWTGGRLASGKGVQSYHSTTLLGWKDLVFRLSGPIPGEPVYAKKFPRSPPNSRLNKYILSTYFRISSTVYTGSISAIPRSQKCTFKDSTQRRFSTVYSRRCLYQHI